MRISKEISGSAEDREGRERQGRGEYEWCGLTSEDPRADRLLGRRISIVLPDGRSIDTGCVFSNQGAKQRIRTAEGVRARDVYPIWHAAAVLMLPRPNRDQNAWGGGLPIMRNGQYGIAHLHMRSVALVGSDNAEIEIERVDVENHYSTESITFDERYQQVVRAWAEKDEFDEPIHNLLARHEELVELGQPSFGSMAGGITAHLQNVLADSAADYGIDGVAPTEDVLPSLLQIIDAPDVPSPISPEAIPDDEPIIRRRDIKQWKHWANSRGASNARFRRQVREAYRSTCVVCGLFLPSLGGGAKAGVDAAHILPWATFDLDEIANGLCLCKLHHWAFDEGLIEIVPNEDEYAVVIPEEAMARIDSANIGFDFSFLRRFEGAIPRERLPKDRRNWPSLHFLRGLREILFS